MRHFLTIAVMAITLTCSGLAFAADEKKADVAPAGGIKIGVVDVQALMAKSKAGKNIELQVNKALESSKAEFAPLEKEIIAMQKELEKMDPKSEEFATKRKSYDKRAMDANRLAQQRRQILDKASGKAVQELEKQIVMAVGEVSKADGYALVVRSQGVVIASNEMDITDKALKALDSKVTEIKVNLEMPAKAEPAKKN